MKNECKKKKKDMTYKMYKPIYAKQKPRKSKATMSEIGLQQGKIPLN